MQLNYGSKMAVGLHGGWYAAHESPDVVSYSAEVPADVLDGTTLGIKGIPFGSVVSVGTNENDQVKLGDPDTKGPFGFAIRDIAREADCCDPSMIGYKNKETVAVMRAGYMYALCIEGCNKGDPVDFDADGVPHNGGGGTDYPNAKWEFQTVAGEIGVIRVVPVS